MAIIREEQKFSKDRAAEDRRRHRQLVEDAIKKNIADIIAEESIIGKSKDKKIKVPIKGMKEYRFIYGRNQTGVISGEGEERRGDRILKGSKQVGPDSGEGAGNQAGEDIYETEITIEDLVKYLFEDLDLPYLERKKLSQIKTVTNFKKAGYKKKGIPPRLAKKKTVMEKIKRKKAYIRSHQDYKDDQRFPFHNEDLRYFRVKEEFKKESNAVIFCIMDTSGSMNQTKKYLARSFYFLLYQFMHMKYENVELVFVAHTTEAKEVSEDDFFHKGESGGTYISSGYEKTLEIIKERFAPSHWNIYCFHCSDGDNWREDNDNAVKMAQKLSQLANLFGFVEIKPNSISSSIKQLFSKEIKADNFILVTIVKKEDIWPTFKKILESNQKG